jgi:hypothetical protein
MSRADAELIVSLVPFVINDAIVVVPKTQAILNFQITGRLASLGLLAPNSVGLGGATMEFQTSDERLPQLGNRPCAAVGHRNKVYFFVANEPKVFRLPCIAVGHIGREVFQIPYAATDDEMLSELAAHLAASQDELYVADATGSIGDRHLFANLTRIQPPPKA